MSATVHMKDDPSPTAWAEFLTAMHSGEQFECDCSMYFYWLEVLPPASWDKTYTFNDGSTIRSRFGFAEGYEKIVAFWIVTKGLDDHPHYFGRQTNVINNGR